MPWHPILCLFKLIKFRSTNRPGKQSLQKSFGLPLFGLSGFNKQRFACLCALSSQVWVRLVANRWHASDVACVQLWWMKPLCVRRVFCFSAVRFIGLKSNILLSFFFQQQRTAYPLRTAKQHCDASCGAGGNNCSLNIIFFAMPLYHASTLLDATVYWQEAVSSRCGDYRRAVLSTFHTADCFFKAVLRDDLRTGS